MDIRNKVLEAMTQVLPKKNIPELFEHQDSLETLNLNSISFISLVVKLEEVFNFEFDDEMLLADRFASLSELCEYIEKEVQ